MKKIIVTLSFITLLICRVLAQEKLTAKEAIKHIGKHIEVCDTVYGTKTLNHKLRLLYLGAAYPNQILTVVQISNHPDFKKSISLNGYKICVEGIVELRKGRPIISASGKIVLSGPVDL